MDDADKFFHFYESTGTAFKWCAAFLEESELKDELSKWCYDTFGEPAQSLHYTDVNECWHDAIVYGEIYFKSDAELTLFKLKWESN